VPRVGAFATVLKDSGEVLVCHRRDLDLWEMPGGGVEDGETPWEAVVREVAEETGLRVAVERLAGVYWQRRRGVLVMQFQCHPVSGVPGPSNEADEVRFVRVDELPKRMTPVVVERLRDWLAADQEVRLAIQDGPSAKEWLRTSCGPSHPPVTARRRPEPG
jgi:8-oxo-dGTP diphosphatase